MGSPVSPSLREATTCLMYSTYLFMVRADRDFDFFILSTTGLTVMLLTLPNVWHVTNGRKYPFMEGGFDTCRILDGFPVPCNDTLFHVTRDLKNSQSRTTFRD